MFGLENKRKSSQIFNDDICLAFSLFFIYLFYDFSSQQHRQQNALRPPSAHDQSFLPGHVHLPLSVFLLSGENRKLSDRHRCGAIKLFAQELFRIT
jgi:hypothetical protein